MKKIISLIFVLAIVCSAFVGCSNSKNVDLSSVMEEINSKYSISGLTVVDDVQKLNRYYQIEEADVKQYAAEFSTDATKFMEIVLVEASDSQTLSKITTTLNNHLDSRISEGKSYSPESVEMLENCSVKTYGNYATLIISDNASDIDEFFASKVK